MKKSSLVGLIATRLCLAALFSVPMIHPLRADANSAEWLFNSSTATATTDSSGNGNTLTYATSPAYGAYSTVDNGFGTGSLEVFGGGGSADYATSITLTSGGNVKNTSLNNTISQATVTFDFESTAALTTGSYLAIRRDATAGDTGYFSVGLVEDGGNLELQLSANAAGKAISVDSGVLSALTLNTFTQFAVTFDEGTVSFYENGNLLSQTSLLDSNNDLLTSIPTDAASNLNLKVGTNPSASPVYFDDIGYLGNEALTQTQIESIAADGLAAGLAAPEPSTTTSFLMGGLLLAGIMLFRRRQNT